jgi:hypothetical protein
VLASQGEAPPQYPVLDDEDDWDESLLSQFAPVELAPLPQLQAAAAAAPTVRRLRALVEWLGEGRKLTGAGDLTLADGKELARLLGLVDPDQLAGLHARSAQDMPGLALLVDWAKQLRLASVHTSISASCKDSGWSGTNEGATPGRPSRSSRGPRAPPVPTSLRSPS